MVLASTSARRGPLSMSAAFRKIWARSCTGFRSHSFLAARAALMALLMSSCGGKGGKAARRRLSRFLSTTRSQGKARGHPPPGTNHWYHHNPESAAPGVDLFRDPWGLERPLEPPCSQNRFHLLNPGKVLLLPPKTAQKRRDREGHSPCWHSSTWPPCVHG